MIHDQQCGSGWQLVVVQLAIKGGATLIPWQEATTYSPIQPARPALPNLWSHAVQETCR